MTPPVAPSVAFTDVGGSGLHQPVSMALSTVSPAAVTAVMA